MNLKTAEDWTNLVDWGGLWHVKETTFQLICSLEEEIRKHLHTLTSTGTPGLREKIVLKQWWCPVLLVYCRSWLNWMSQKFMTTSSKMIVQLFGTVRGFAYASSWIERYKQTAKKSTQWSKSLRENTLYSSWYISHTSYYVTLPTLYDIMSNNNVICDPLLKGVFCEVHIIFVASAITFGDMPTHWDNS